MIERSRGLLLVAGVTAFVLLIPLTAMQLTSEVKWTPLDFLTMGVLVFGTGVVFDLVMRKTRSRTYRVLLGIVVAIAFLYVWAELAVGVFTAWGS